MSLRRAELLLCAPRAAPFFVPAFAPLLFRAPLTRGVELFAAVRDFAEPDVPLERVELPERADVLPERDELPPERVDVLRVAAFPPDDLDVLVFLVCVAKTLSSVKISQTGPGHFQVPRGTLAGTSSPGPAKEPLE